MKLNYSALSEPVTDEMIKEYASKGVSVSSLKTIFSIAFVLFLCIAVPMILSSISSSGGVTSSVITVLGIGIVVFVIAVFAARYGSKLAAKESVRMRRFADANDAVFKENISAPTLSGMIFNEGHTRLLKNSLSFNTGIEIGNSSFSKGSGKNQRTYNYSFARVALNRNLPHMVLDAKSNNFLGSNLPNAFDASQRMQLEGDFNTYFDVYAPEGYQRDALYVFTPDVMQVLVDLGAKYDMEIVGTDIYIFKSGTINLAKESELDNILKIVESIGLELRDQTKRYTDERTQDNTVNNMGITATSMPVVAAQGRQLKKRYPIGITIFLIFVNLAIFLPPFLPPDVSDVVVITMWPAIIITVIIFGFVNMIQRK